MSPVLVRVQGAVLTVPPGTRLADVALRLTARGLALSPRRTGPVLDTRPVGWAPAQLAPTQAQ